MRSFRKPALLLALVAVVALALPAVAGASKIESKPGTLTQVGAKITATSNDAYLTSSLFGNQPCHGGGLSPWTMYETLTKNNGTTFEGSSAAAGTATCQLTANGIFPIINPRWENFISSTAGKGTVSMSFETTVTELTCKWSGTAMPFTYVLGSSSITFTQAHLKATPAGCGTASFTGDFELKTFGTIPVILN